MDGKIEETLRDLADRLKGRADNAYIDCIRQMSSTPCLRWEAKVRGGKFGDAELTAHTYGGTLLGKHQVYSDAAKTVRDALAAVDAARGKERV